MATAAWKPDYTAHSMQVWEEFQRTHDLTEKLGQVAAIDPESEHVWIGFNGDLELPHSLGTVVNARFFGRGLSLLAGGQSLEEEHYLVEFPFDGEIVRALATFVDGNEILIGTHLLIDYRLMRRLVIIRFARRADAGNS